MYDIEKTMAGLSRKGTYSYMAPEIYNGQAYGFDADIYSLGIVLYKMLNNNRDPFLPAYPAPVKYGDKTEAMIKRIQGLPMPKPENADERLSGIVLKACAHKSADRYQHPKDLRLDLEAVAAGYIELESEVFSENGINYYTNNSIFGTASSSSVAKPEQKESTADASVQQDVGDDEEGTMMMTKPAEAEEAVVAEEPTDDEGTMMMGASILFGTTNIAVNELENNAAEYIVPPVKEVPSALHFTPDDAQSMQCPACGMPVKVGSSFCGRCGKSLVDVKPKLNYCPCCGSKIKPGIRFCGKCGKKL